MPTYSGSCHCGAVRFEVRGDLTIVSECNCSMCRKKGTLHWRVPAEDFTLLSGKDNLQLYQFGTKTARNWFCRTCGIHPYHNPRIAPDMFSVNVRCLDDVDIDAIPRRQFDGKNWEEAARKFGWKG